MKYYREIATLKVFNNTGFVWCSRLQSMFMLTNWYEMFNSRHSGVLSHFPPNNGQYSPLIRSLVVSVPFFSETLSVTTSMYDVCILCMIREIVHNINIQCILWMSSCYRCGRLGLAAIQRHGFSLRVGYLHPGGGSRAVGVSKFLPYRRYNENIGKKKKGL